MSKLYGIILSLLVIAAVCVSLPFLTAGCGGESATPDGSAGQVKEEIPLQTLSQGEMSEYGRIDEMPLPEDAPPECQVITEEEQYQRLLSLAYFPETPGEVDFDRYIVIAAMQGPKSTSGHAISITYASQTGSDIRVELEVLEPQPGSMTAQVLTSPYHLVLAERSSFDPRGELFFTFVDGDDVRISQQYAEI